MSIYWPIYLFTYLTVCLLWFAAGTNIGEQSLTFGFDTAPQPDDPSNQGDVMGLEESLPSPMSPSKTPPPLPEKKRHSEQTLLHQNSDFVHLLEEQRP